MRSRTERPSASDISVTFSRFGRKRRLVLRFEWLTRWPIWRVFPVSSQRHGMTEIPLNFPRPAARGNNRCVQVCPAYRGASRSPSSAHLPAHELGASNRRFRENHRNDANPRQETYTRDLHKRLAKFRTGVHWPVLRSGSARLPEPDGSELISRTKRLGPAPSALSICRA